MADADAFPTEPHQTFTLTSTNDSDTDEAENEFPGMFQGVPGTYTCTNTDCTVLTDEDGKLMTLGGGALTFTPAKVADDGDPHVVRGVTPDPSYVYFGYWLHVTDPGGEKEAIGVDAFAGGPSPIGAIDSDTGMGGIDGSASYSGKAGGKYAIKTLTSRGAVNSLYTGQFVADVELMAIFGGPEVPSADWDKISGTVSDFEDAADSDSTRLDHWTVSLGTASTNAIADVNGDGLNDNVGKTNDGTMGGTWTHTFHGRA